MSKSAAGKSPQHVLPTFRSYAWFTLGYNILVILWGAFVRATGSGMGCGGNWPLCSGQVFPPDSAAETLVEYIHRVSSGIALLLVVGMLIWAVRRFPRRHIIRRGAVFSMAFMISEALLGAGLVLFGWVVDNASLGRVIVQVIHLLNTHFLLAAIAVTAWAASGRTIAAWKVDRSSLPAYLGLFSLLILSAAGAVTALGDTIFPPESLAAGIAQDFSPTSHFLIRLRIWHPLIAVGIGLYLLILIRLVLEQAPRPSILRSLGWFVLAGYGLQLAAGALNVYLLAPVWMQIVHLLLADGIWIGALLLANQWLLYQQGTDSEKEN
jgi:heme A synthase